MGDPRYLRSFVFPRRGDLVLIRSSPTYRLKKGETAETVMRIFLRFNSYIHGTVLPESIDVTEPIAGRYFVWDHNENRIEGRVTRDILAELTVIGHPEEVGPPPDDVGCV